MKYEFRRDVWASRIYQARTNMEITQSEFAALYGISPTTVCHWEKEIADPMASHFLAICIDNNWNPSNFLDYIYVAQN